MAKFKSREEYQQWKAQKLREAKEKASGRAVNSAASIEGNDNNSGEFLKNSDWLFEEWRLNIIMNPKKTGWNGALLFLLILAVGLFTIFAADKYFGGYFNETCPYFSACGYTFGVFIFFVLVILPGLIAGGLVLFFLGKTFYKLKPYTESDVKKSFY
jgi:hypothetical protein